MQVIQTWITTNKVAAYARSMYSRFPSHVGEQLELSWLGCWFDGTGGSTGSVRPELEMLGPLFPSDRLPAGAAPQPFRLSRHTACGSSCSSLDPNPENHVEAHQSSRQPQLLT